MLPSLGALRLQSEEDTDVRVKRANESDDAPSAKTVKRPVYPSSEVVRFDYEALQTLASDQTNRVSGTRWMFAASPDGIFGYRFTKSTIIEFGKLKVTGTNMIADVSGQFATTDNEDKCGTSNCFVSGVRLLSESPNDAEKALKVAIATLKPTEGLFVLPEAVSVRAPRLVNDEEFDNEIEEKAWSELAITLEMARLGVTVPILAAIPVVVTNEKGNPVGEAFAIVTEDGWLDLGRTMRGIEGLGGPRRMYDALSQGLAEILRKVASTNILLLDIKSQNIVAKLADDQKYAVRMIDFDAVFSVDVNRHVSETGLTTSDCVFFVNGLLAVNYAIKVDTRFLQSVFRPIVLDVVSQWRFMQKSHLLGAFCAALDVDKKFAQEFIPASRSFLGAPSPTPSLYAKDLYNVSETEFFRALKRSFYLVLEHYGDDEITQTKKNFKMTGYVSAVVEHIANSFRLEESEIKARVEKRMKA